MAYVAGADRGVSSDSSGAELAPWPYRSFRDTDPYPSQRALLGALIRLQPYQSDPSDPAFADRIAHLRASTASYEDEEAFPEWNPHLRTSIRSVITSAVGVPTDEGPALRRLPPSSRSFTPVGNG